MAEKKAAKPTKTKTPKGPKTYYLGTGRRKTAVARVRLAEGQGPDPAAGPGRAGGRCGRHPGGRGPCRPDRRHDQEAARLRLPDPGRPDEGAEEVRPPRRPPRHPVLEAVTPAHRRHRTPSRP